jgi:hypothetical protein
MTSVRVMKARRVSLCDYCGGAISVGRKIILVGAVWVHLDPCGLKMRGISISSLPPTGTG